MIVFLSILSVLLAVLNIYFSLQLKKIRREKHSLTQEATQSSLPECELEVELVVSSEDDYFKSKHARILFLLLEVDGKRRNALLGITPNMYNDNKAADKWYYSLTHYVHPDKYPMMKKPKKRFSN